MARVLTSGMVRCKHVHVSGRRCNQWTHKKQRGLYCGFHADKIRVTDRGNVLPVCAECSSLLQTFTPPRGW